MVYTMARAIVSNCQRATAIPPKIPPRVGSDDADSTFSRNLVSFIVSPKPPFSMGSIRKGMHIFASWASGKRSNMKRMAMPACFFERTGKSNKELLSRLEVETSLKYDWTGREEQTYDNHIPRESPANTKKVDGPRYGILSVIISSPCKHDGNPLSRNGCNTVEGKLRIPYQTGLRWCESSASM